MWQHPSHQYWFLFWWQWALICTKAFMVAHTVFPTLSSQPAGFESPKIIKGHIKKDSNHVVIAKSRPRQFWQSYLSAWDPPKIQSGSWFGSTFCHISWVMSPLKKFQLPRSQKSHQSVEAWEGQMDGWMWDAQLWVEWSVHTTAGISKKSLGTNPQSHPEMSKLLQGKMVLCALFVNLPALSSSWNLNLASFKATSSSTRAMMQHTVWIFFMAYFRWNMLQDRTTWKK